MSCLWIERNIHIIKPDFLLVYFYNGVLYIDMRSFYCFCFKSFENDSGLIFFFKLVVKVGSFVFCDEFHWWEWGMINVMRVVKLGLNANKKWKIRIFLWLENFSLVCQVKIFCNIGYLLINDVEFILSKSRFYM